MENKTLLRLTRAFNRALGFSQLERIYSEKQFKAKEVYNYIEV